MEDEEIRNLYKRVCNLITEDYKLTTYSEIPAYGDIFNRKNDKDQLNNLWYKDEKLRLNLKEEHSIVFFIYHFILGIILVQLLSVSLVKGLLFFIIILFHSTLSTASLKEIHQKMVKKKIFKIILSVSTLIGIVFALFINLPQVIHFILIGFIAGALLYIVVRDVIPKQADSKLMYFLFGALLYMVLIMLTWL